MLVFWLILIVTVFLATLFRGTQVEVYPPETDLIEYRYSLKSLFVIMIPFMVFVGLRSEFGDTTGYIDSYLRCEGINFNLLDNRAYGFSILQQFCKQYIFKSPYAWLFLLMVICLIPILKNISRYSSDARTSLFLFIASTEFTFLMNGLRQFLAVCIIFGALQYLIKRNPVKYYLLIALACTFHLTAIIMLPVYFLAKMKPWGIKMWLTVLGMSLVCVFSSQFLKFADDVLVSGSVYSHYMKYLYDTSGVKVIRTLTHFAPVVLSFIYRKRINEINDPVMNCCLAFSVVNAMVFAFSSVIGGNLTGRFAEYFTIYNLLLYPYIFTRCMSEKTYKIIKPLFVISYIAFFYYQMDIAWGISYISKVLGIGV